MADKIEEKKQAGPPEGQSLIMPEQEEQPTSTVSPPEQPPKEILAPTEPRPPIEIKEGPEEQPETPSPPPVPPVEKGESQFWAGKESAQDGKKIQEIIEAASGLPKEPGELEKKIFGE